MSRANKAENSANSDPKTVGKQVPSRMTVHSTATPTPILDYSGQPVPER